MKFYILGVYYWVDILVSGVVDLFDITMGKWEYRERSLVGKYVLK